MGQQWKVKMERLDAEREIVRKNTVLDVSFSRLVTERGVGRTLYTTV